MKNWLFYLLVSQLVFSAILIADSFDTHKIEAMPQTNGKSSYETNCASCHHKSRIGFSAPPLLPQNLKRYNDEKLLIAIKSGFPNTLMPKFEHLSHREIRAIITYLRSDAGEINFNLQDIRKSRVLYKNKKTNLHIKNLQNITPVVERDANSVWIMEDDKIVAKYPVKNVHGGIKYIMDGSAFFVPSRDGVITRISLQYGRVEASARACVSMRNISVSKDNRAVIATCLLPKQIVILDTKDLTPSKIIPIDGVVSSLYDLYSEDKAIFTFRDKPQLGIMNTKNFNIEYIKLKEPLEDFFIDPFDRYIIGTARKGKLLSVFDLKTKTYPFEYAIGGMPHLFAATYWYHGGKFYFASPHLGQNYISVWQMYEWKLTKQVDIGGSGFFAKTHPNTPYIFADNGTDTLSLIDKNSFTVKSLVPSSGQLFNHTEYSGDGKYTYLSISEKNGSIKVLDTLSLKELKSYPANIPVGKYNFINKNRVFYRSLFGKEIFEEKCKSCHANSQNMSLYKTGKSHPRLDNYEIESLKSLLDKKL